MKYFSEQLSKVFDTEEQCLAAEEKARQEAENKKITKAKLAHAVEEADKELETAYSMFETAKKEVELLQQEYDLKVDAIMEPARNKIRECTQNKAKAIEEFNKNFGPYTTSYTGAKAVHEMNKMDNLFSMILENMFKG